MYIVHYCRTHSPCRLIYYQYIHTHTLTSPIQSPMTTVAAAMIPNMPHVERSYSLRRYSSSFCFHKKRETKINYDAQLLMIISKLVGTCHQYTNRSGCSKIIKNTAWGQQNGGGGEGQLAI